jgi:hypothetical protein
MGNLQQRPELDAETQRIRLNFLQTDLALCFTFADLSRIELEIGDWDAARGVLAEAEEGHAIIARFLPYIADVKRRNEIERELNDLRTTLDSAGCMLATPASFVSRWVEISD